MSDLISREAAIEAIEKAVTKECALWRVKAMPTAEKVGKWIGTDDFDEYYRCSECGRGETQFGRLYRYCPNCGARLIGEEDA